MRTLIDDLARQVAANPDRLALADGDRRRTFSELDCAANRVSHALLERCGPQEPVGVLLGHSAQAIVALLGVTKAGQIRLALDPSAPPDRLSAVLDHAGARLVLTDRAHRAALPDSVQVEVLELERLPAGLSENDPRVELPAEALLSLVYTSGSTGAPKAVAVGHRDAAELVASFDEDVPFRPGDRVAVVAGLSFAGMRSVDRALARGASVHLFDLAAQGTAALARWLAAEQINYVAAFSTTVRALLDELPARAGLPDLRLLITGGEPLHRADVERVHARIGSQCEIVFGYASTELGGLSTLLRIDRDTPLDEDGVPAGRPRREARISLADAGPDGVGEIVVSSPYVAQGYWRDPESTAARFAAEPTDPRFRSFQTGDLGRFRPDGMLVVLGRSDARVKIRGYSVDTSEVELVLAGVDGVERATVMKAPAAQQDRLIAYYVATPGERPTVNALRRALLAKLPPYMVPAAFARVDGIPLTGSGKVDRLALPPVAGRPELEEPYEAPRDDLERTLVRIWEDVLDVRPVGVYDGFYALGGDSLRAARAKVLAGEALRVELPLMLFAEPTATIAAHAQALRTREAALFSPVVPLQTEGSAPPFFCVHGVGGEILDLSGLGPLLAPDVPFYGLQLVGNEGDRAVRTVPGLARHYLRLIEAIRPEGPYVLGGYSAGGAVAYEMAQQLVAAGGTPPAVVLLDAPAPAMLHAWDLNGGAPGERRQGRARKLLLRLVLDLHVLSGTTIPPRWRERYRTTAGRRALRRYAPEPYAGPIVLLQTTVEDLPRGLGWRALAPNGFRVVEVQGDHHSMLMPPHVENVATALRSQIATALAGLRSL
jgi:amino acid adenylation domain-containing protein